MAESNLEEEACNRLKAAKRQKNYRIKEYRECYFLAAPSRDRTLTSGAPPARGPELDYSECYTDLATIAVDDFVTELFNTFMPPEQKWCERGPGIGIPDEVFNSVKDQVAREDDLIFKAMKASNLYAVIPMMATPDLAIAGCGLWIDQSRAYEPIKTMAVPMREIEVNLGPDGEVDDKFIVRYVRNCHVRSVLGKELSGRIPSDVAVAIDGKDKGDKSTEVTWGYWRLWDREDGVVYRYVVLVGDKLIHQEELVGEGACPFIFMRFKATADWPWAVGPLMQGLPTLRQIDEWERVIPEAIERYVASPLTFPDDSFANIPEDGFEPNGAYAIRTGSENAVKRIYDQPPPDPALGDLDRKEHRLRKIFYIDHPEQSGDTPPTLGQWLDELARAQRRIGTPGQPFWREGPRAIFLRFKYLLAKSGSVNQLEDKEGRAIATLPYNPAQRAAEQQEIATAFQCAQALAQMFPEEWRVWIDGKGTMEAIIEKMRTAELLKMRSEQDVKAALGQITQLLGQGGLRQQAGAPVPEGAGAPAAA
jgi:hypothetical protein